MRSASLTAFTAAIIRASRLFTIEADQALFTSFLVVHQIIHCGVESLVYSLLDTEARIEDK